MTMRKIVRKMMFTVSGVMCLGIAIALFYSAITQPAVASSIEIAQQQTDSPSVKLIGGAGANRSYRFTINRLQDLVYLHCPENYAPKFGYIRNLEAIRCERFQSTQ
jgi:hypothetical protein